MYGKLVFRDILTRLEGPDPQHPAKKGAVLTAITAISYATLAPGAIANGKAGRQPSSISDHQRNRANYRECQIL